MTATFYVGDALEVMATLPTKSVDLILSSPPFLALRSYLPADHPDKSKEGGSQATPGAYIDWLVDVVEACDRVLAPHGSLCFELGDTYASHDYGTGGDQTGQTNLTFKAEDGNRPTVYRPKRTTQDRDWPLAKSLSLIPELFRYTLVYGQNPLTGRQTERWRLRNVIRWVRPNPPVGALGDKFRPATSELMVFCKSAKRFFDLDTVRDDTPRTEHYRNRQNEPSMQRGGQWSTFPDMMTQGGAPPLDWWNIPPGGYEGAHYAVWPPELCVKPIKAMCPEKVCRVCGEPSRRQLTLQPEEAGQRSIAEEIARRRNTLGISRADMIPWFPHYKNGESIMAQVSNWELAKNVPSSGDWEILKERLGVSAIFDDLVYGVRRWTELSVTDEYRKNLRHGEGSMYSAKTAEPKARHGARTMTTQTAEYVTAGFSDCDHQCKKCGGTGKVTKYRRVPGLPPGGVSGYQSTTTKEICPECEGISHWRPGLVLDPFVGSGTTLAVATGHGRDAIGIDLDARNYDLALERVGPLILQRGEVAA